MKFKNMSFNELKKEFEKILDSFSQEQLLNSLKKYELNNNDYTYEMVKVYTEELYPAIEITNESPTIEINNMIENPKTFEVQPNKILKEAA